MKQRTFRMWLSFVWIVGLSAVVFINCSDTIPSNEKNKEVVSDGGNSKEGKQGETTPDGTVKPEPRPEVKPEPRPEVKPEPRPEPRPEVKPEPRPEPTVDAVADSGSEPVPEVKPESYPEVLPEGTKVPTSLFFRMNKVVLETDLKKGTDLNGDGKVDNQLGAILGDSSIKALLKLAGIDVQKSIDDQVSNRDLVVLVELRNLKAPFTANGSADVHVYLGKKTSVIGEYRIDKTSVDGSGKAKIQFNNVKVNRGRVVTPPGNFGFTATFFKGSGPANLDMKQASLSFNIAGDLKSLSNGMVSGAVPASTVDDWDAFTGQTILSLLISSVPKLAQPDVDLDKDGIEKLGVSGSAMSCTDGDGKTKVFAPNPCPGGKTSCNCVQSPKMADGFSSTLSFTAGQSKIVP